MSQCSPICVQPILGLLGLMDLGVYFSFQVWKVFSHYCCKCTFCPFLFFWKRNTVVFFFFFPLCPISPMCVLSCFSRVPLFATTWTIARQAPLSMGFSKQEYWSGLPWPPPWDLSNPGIKPTSLLSPALVGGSLPLVPPGKPP